MTTILVAIVCVVFAIITETNAYLYCLSDCHFSRAFDSPPALADKCNKIQYAFFLIKSD